MARCVDPQEEEEEEAPKKGGFTMFGRKPVVEELLRRRPVVEEWRPGAPGGLMVRLGCTF